MQSSDLLGGLVAMLGPGVAAQRWCPWDLAAYCVGHTQCQHCHLSVALHAEPIAAAASSSFVVRAPVLPDHSQLQHAQKFSKPESELALNGASNEGAWSACLFLSGAVSVTGIQTKILQEVVDTRLCIIAKKVQGFLALN